MKTETILIILAIVAFGFVLFNPQIFTSQTYILASCGNSVCEPDKGESYLNCNLDCIFCGNNICESNRFPPEHFDSCPQDCHVNNGLCDYNETCKNSDDCKCNAGQFCGDYGCQNIPAEPIPEKSFWDKELFKIGEFSVTGLTIIIALGSLLVLGFSIGK